MIIVDASVLVSFANDIDQKHEEACAVVEQIKGGQHGEPLVLSEAFAETANVLGLRKINRADTIRFCHDLQVAYKITFANAQVFSKAFDIYSNSKRPLSFTDCLQLQYARTYGAKIASFDADLNREAGNLAIK